MIELIVAMAVLLAVMAAALTVFLPSLGRFALADTEYDAQRHAMTAVTAMAADLRESRGKYLEKCNADNASAFFIPTPRDASGAFMLSPDAQATLNDESQWQRWIAYYTSDDPLAGTHRLFRLHRAFTSDLNGSSVGGRVVASGLRSVSVQIGDKDSLEGVRALDAERYKPDGFELRQVGNSKISLKVQMISRSLWTTGGRGVVRLEVVSERVLHDRITLGKGEKTVDVLY